MHFRCPLCLKRLLRDDRFAKFCPRHPQANLNAIRTYDPDEPDGGFRCEIRECDRHKFVRPDGLMFQHLGCRLEVKPGVLQPTLNPFWNGTTVHVDDRVDLPRGGAPAAVTVHHWQLPALAQVPRTNPEMWFPAALLSRHGDRRHVLVSLSGAKSAGKTYLAHHSAYAGTYAAEPKPEDDFFFIHQGDRPTGHREEFLRTLNLAQLLREDRHDWFDETLESTSSRPRNLKAMLFRQPPQPLVVPFAFRRPTWLRELYNDIKGKVGRQGLEPEPDFRALLFYDLAGEAVERHHLDVLRHDEEMDVLVIVLSLEDLQRTNVVRASTIPAVATAAAPPDPLSLAKERLTHIRSAKMRDTRRRSCLIITKCDTGPVEARNQTGLRALAIDAARKLGETDLASAIERAGAPQSDLDRVFCTWRERKSLRNVVHGLEDFVRWCMD